MLMHLADLRLTVLAFGFPIHPRHGCWGACGVLCAGGNGGSRTCCDVILSSSVSRRRCICANGRGGEERVLVSSHRSRNVCLNANASQSRTVASH